jgi:pyruvate kinase
VPQAAAERRTKIVATIGPSSRDPRVLARLVDAGVDVARLNVSHGSLDEHADEVRAVRRAAARARRHVGVLLDLQGPKIRVGSLEGGGPVRLDAGRTIVIEPGRGAGSAERITTTYRNLPRDVSRGDTLLVDDGLLRLRIARVERSRVTAEVVVGGLLREHKGINLPGVAVSAPSLTPKDLRDLAFGLAAGVDFVALSFVRRAADVRALRRAIARASSRRVAVIAKVEKPEAVDRIDEILREADGIMVARGDLGVEVAPEKVPAIQKALIRRANGAERVVITATQMLESMIAHPVPTRAEASDVANAIFDGTDAVMLSGETAAGRYPVEAVRMMAAIAREAESHGELIPERRLSDRAPAAAGDAARAHAIARAACYAAREAGVGAIVVLTLSGRTALTISKMKPPVRVVAIAADDGIANRMALYRGVVPLTAPLARTTEVMIANADRRLLATRSAARGDEVVLVAGSAVAAGATNMIKLHRVGEGLRAARGTWAARGARRGARARR